MKKEVKKDSAKNANVNANVKTVHVEGKSGKELVKNLEKAVVEKQSAPAAAESNLPAKKTEVFDLQVWYDKNLGAIDCEKCAWSLAQTITMTDPKHAIYAHVHSNGEKMFCTNGRVAVTLKTPVMPAGVYDPVLAGKGNAKRRTFLPVNAPNAFDKINKIVKDADDPKINPIIAEETFDFSINAPLYDTIFAMQFFNAAHGFILSDIAISTITAACQPLKFKLGQKFSVLENEFLSIIFMSMVPRAQEKGKSKVLEIIGKYKFNMPAMIEAETEPAPEKKPETEPEKSVKSVPSVKSVKKPAKKGVKKTK